MCLNMAASCGARCILNLAPMSCLTSAFCGHHAPWSLCHGVFTLPYSHIPACSLQNPARTRAVSRPSPQACADGNLSWCLFKFLFSLHLTRVLRLGPSFLHGGLVWNYFLLMVISWEEGGWVSESVGVEFLLHFRRRRNLPLLELQL